MRRIKQCQSHRPFCDARIKRGGKPSLCCRFGWCRYANDVLAKQVSVLTNHSTRPAKAQAGYLSVSTHEIKMDNNAFNKQYLCDWSHIKSMPKRCPYCNRVLIYWDYEKSRLHIEKCANKQNKL